VLRQKGCSLVEIKLLMIIFCFSISLGLLAKTPYTYVAKENKNDIRFSYEKQVLELALNKTKAEFGDFTMQPSDVGINTGRLMQQMTQGVYENYFFKMSITDQILEDFYVINFPIDRGVVGYRIAFTHQKNRYKLKSATELKALKKKYIVQGIGWLDADILQANGLNVFALTDNDRMFQMVSFNRVDYYFRGINEIKNDLQSKSRIYPNVILEPYIALHYPLPRFFVTAKNNIENAKRVELGLKRAFEDGSFIKLWETIYLENIQFLDLKKRHIIELENPFIKNIDPSYKKYNYKFTEYSSLSTADN